MMTAMIASIAPRLGVNHMLVMVLIVIMLMAFIKYLKN